MDVQVSPDLPPGRTLSVTGTGDVTITAVADAPQVRMDRTWRIELMPNGNLATLVNATRGITYNASSNNWNTMMAAASNGDTIEISPGFIHASQADMNNYFSNNIQGALLAVWKAVNLKGMDGRGRWELYAGDDILTNESRNASGIVVYSPSDLGVRGNISIADFQFDNWAQSGAASGVRIVQNFVSTSSWSDFHESITLRNFKIGKRPFFRSASGISGAAETWTIEDGHIYDTGGGINANSGQDHNAYISGRQLFMRGVRMNRTRGGSALGWWEGGSSLDGHHAKLTFNYATIEGCVFDCGPRGDSTFQVQMKGGGNLVLRGCLLIAGKYSRSGTGNVMFEKEENNFGGWTYGLAGHSVLVERNVFISHYPYIQGVQERPFVNFRPPGDRQEVIGVSSVVIRDNIGMNAVPDAKWIGNDPSAGGSWRGRGNSVETYDSGESPFLGRDLLLYARAAGTLAAGFAVPSNRRYVWPHGSTARTDAFQGLG